MLIICLLMPLLVKIDATISEVIMTNDSYKISPESSFDAIILWKKKIWYILLGET